MRREIPRYPISQPTWLYRSRGFRANAEVPPPLRKDEVVDDGGEVYLCNARCLRIWSVLLATKPGLDDKMKTQKLILKFPSGTEKSTDAISGLALWATAEALDVG